MRFKKLELLGFKSFAEPTELIFEPGVTAVVGPNGCGKSNIADAIKWVLGEQSARELRGGKMEDLIFNGSDRRDPIHYAEVSLTLDNSEKELPIDYAEVAISRRLFRSGESEYLLNGTAVRLKDIHELLMGTGIGTSAYSLFEQGRIEQIISARPEDRRVVFEEAAGITKFKAQKREAVRKLDETEENLARVSDVVAEVKRQIQGMERQVRRAKLYQEQFEELKTLELRVARRETARLSALWTEKDGVLSGFRAQAAALEAQSQSWESRLSEARAKVSQAEEALSRAKEGLLAVTHRQETLRANLETNRERMAEDQTRTQTLREEISVAEAQVGRLGLQLKELSEIVARQEQERREKEEKIIQCQSRLEQCARLAEEAQRALSRAREQVLEVTSAQVQVKNGLNRVKQECARLEARAGRLHLEKGKVALEQQEASAQVESLEAQLARSRGALNDLEQQRNRDQAKLDSADASLKSVQQEVGGLEQDMTRVTSQLEMLKGLLATHEGYSSGVKALLTALDSGALDRTGVVGVLAELIQVNREDTAAVDAALGSWAEAVVVESGSTAERCRDFLERSKAGRVLFILLDRVPSAPDSSAEPAPAAGGTPLADRVGITPHLSSLISLLLADTWLVPSRTSAAETPSLTRRCVTPDGELWTCASALLGSAPSEEGMIVGRMSRLQSLEVARGHNEGLLEEARTRLIVLEADRSSLVEALTGQEESIRGRSEESHRLEAHTLSAKTTLEKLQQEERVLQTEESEVSAELAGIREEVDRWEKELAAKDQEMGTLQGAIHQAQETIAEVGRSREETAVELATAQTEMASFDEVADSRRASVQVLNQSLESARAQGAARRDEVARLEQRQSQWETECAGLEQGLRQFETELIQAQALTDQAEGVRSDALRATEAQEKEFLVVRKQLEQVQSQLHTHEMEQAQVVFQREQITARLQQVYQLELSLDSSDSASAEDLPESFQERITELSQKLQRMGPVNLGSIDEERELQNRYEYLTTQQADLVKAKEDLHEALLKINRTTRAMFRETFQAIHKEFQITFKQLFGGGEARLILMDEEDLLESGIEIIARPPGKALQPISLLSGGEKALTTIALLFAIFRIKPSPFCLLDEIDAPLDEINVDRFTRALREFLKDSQFIIITHNKKTMSMADVMYGITMQEMGVSKIVSVKFKQAVPAV